MIDKNMLKKDLKVVYVPSHVRSKRYSTSSIEYGEISSWNNEYIFVIYNGDLHSKATKYEDLYEVSAYRAGFLLNR